MNKLITDAIKKVADEQVIITGELGEEITVTKADAMARGLFEKALKGNIPAIKFIKECLDGKAPTVVNKKNENEDRARDILDELTEKGKSNISEAGGVIDGSS